MSVLSGRGTLIPVEAFRRVGLYDQERLPHYGADWEFSRRAQRAGFELLLDYRARVFSREGATGFDQTCRGSACRSLCAPTSTDARPTTCDTLELRAHLRGTLPFPAFLASTWCGRSAAASGTNSRADTARSMRILIAHVRYGKAGGEDVVFETETALLRKAGEEVAVLDFSGEHFDQLRVTTKVAIAANYADHAFGRRLMADAVERFRPDVVHFHNVYPILGPGAIAEGSGAAARRCRRCTTTGSRALTGGTSTSLRVAGATYARRARSYPASATPAIGTRAFRAADSARHQGALASLSPRRPANTAYRPHRIHEGPSGRSWSRPAPLGGEGEQRRGAG